MNDNMTEAYKKSIQIVADGTFNAQQVAVDLAKSQPDLFIELATNPQVEVLPWRQIAIPLLRHGLKIPAIKEVRYMMGWGLRESKEAVEALLADDPMLDRECQEALARKR